MKPSRLAILLILVLTMLYTTTVIHVSQAAIPPGFDRSRVRLETKIGHKVVLQCDQIEFYGTLIRQVPISEKELEDLIRQTMEDLGIDSLEKLNEIVNKAEQWDEITQEEIDQFIQDLTRTVKLVPNADKVANILSILNRIRTNRDPTKSVDEFLYGLLKDGIIDQLEKALEDAIELLIREGKEPDALFTDLMDEYNDLKGAKSKLSALKNYWEYLKFLLEKYKQDVQKYKDRADAAMAKAMLNAFYEELQRRIDRLRNSKRDDKPYWVIEFDKATAQRQNFSFFGVGGNNQTWELNMRLQQTEQTGEFSFDSENVAGSAAGTYEGEYTIKTDSDLTAFAAFPQESVMNIGVHGDVMLWNINLAKQINPQNEFYLEPVSQGIAHNLRIVKGRCSAYVLESGEIQLHVEPGEEAIMNTFSDIKFVINEKNYNPANSEFLYHIALDAEIKAVPYEKMVFVDYADKGYLVASNPKYDWDALRSNLAEGLEIAVMFDEAEMREEPDFYDWDDSEIWKPWDKSIKTMRIVK